MFEWPGAPIELADGVNASVAVPGAIRPAEALGPVGRRANHRRVRSRWLPALATGIQRLFILAVAPREPDCRPVRSAYGAPLRAFEINQFSEELGLARAEAVNEEIRRWSADIAAVFAALGALPTPSLRRS